MSNGTLNAGQMYGNLTAIRPSADKLYHWLCQCSCGASKIISAYHVNSGHTSSCGCHRKKHMKSIGTKNKVHGLTSSSTYNSWKSLKRRCNNPSYEWFHLYGGRGISYADKWETFGGFLEDMGEKPKKGWHIDRINNDGNYCKENCRWVEPKINLNNRSNTKIWTVHGIKYDSLSDAANANNVTTTTIVSWCKGVKSYPPKENCSVNEKFTNRN